MDITKIFSSFATGVLSTAHQFFFASVIMAILFTFAYRYFRRYGVKNGILLWVKKVKNNKEFRNTFIMAFVVSMVLYKTLLCRLQNKNPLANVWGSWGIYDKKGNITTGSIQNGFMFVLPVFMLLLLYSDKIFKKKKESFWRVITFSTGISFAASLTIEFLQMFFCIGAFQISDLAYNTLGGVLGAIIYYIVKIIKKKGTEK